MGSIPLPALDVKVPQQPDLLEKFSQLQQLRGQQQAQQMQQQEAPLRMQALQQGVDTGAVDLQQKQIQLKDQQAMNAAMKQWSQVSKPAASTPGTAPQASSLPDYDSLIDLAKKNGASFSAIQGLQKSVLGMKAQASTIAKDDAQAGTANATALKTKNGMLIDSLSGVANLPDYQLVQGLLSTAQDLASKGLLDPQHVQMAQQLAQSGDPSAIRHQLNAQISGLGGFTKLVEDAQKKVLLEQQQGKGDPSSPFYAPSDAAVAMGTAPGATQIQAGKAKQAAAVAGADAAARQPYEMSLAAQKQALSQGDPKAAGQLLINGDATLSELKSRGATPDFIARALFSARQQSGGKYNAQEAESNFNVAKSQANVGFFGSAKSLTDKGGTLDQLAEAAKAIPQHDIPVFNTFDDAVKAASGSGPIAKYASLLVGVADDYSKVMGGGAGSDTSRNQAIKLVPADASPEQRSGAIQGIRGAVSSQINSRIGSNPIMRRMYASPDSAQPSTTSAAPAGLKDTGQTTKNPDGVYDKGGKHYTVVSGKVYE